MDGKKDITLYDIVREEFLKELALKTGWGRVEVMQAFDKAFARGMIRYAQMNGMDLT